MTLEAINIEELKARVTQALDTLLEQDADLLNRDVQEEAISHRLARYLETLFETWNVDCEFNMDRDKRKRTPLPQKQNPEVVDDALVRPDIIIHKRGTSNNLLAIEVKKSSNKDRGEIARDRMKVESYINNPLKYRSSAFIIIRTDQSIDKPYKIEWHGTEFGRPEVADA